MHVFDYIRVFHWYGAYFNIFHGHFSQVARKQSSRFHRRRLFQLQQVRIDSLFGWCCSMKIFLASRRTSSPLGMILPKRPEGPSLSIYPPNLWQLLRPALVIDDDPPSRLRKPTSRITSSTPIALAQLGTSGNRREEKIFSEIGKVQSFFQHLFFFLILL